MASQPQQPRDARSTQRGGISIRTLVIASCASAAAAYVVSRIWGAGTLFGAAATPVIVALVSEALRRPVEKLPAISVVRPGGSTPAEHAAARPDPPAGAGAGAGAGATAQPPTIVLPNQPPDQPAIVVPDDVAPAAFTAPRQHYSTTHRNRWRIALLTGLAAFAIVAVVYTITDLASGTSVTGSGSSSLFDFSTRRHRASTTGTDTTTSTSTTKAKTTTTGTATTQVTKTVTVPATTPTVTVTTPTTTSTTPATTTPPVPAGAQAAPDATTTATTPAAPAATP